MPNRSSRYAVGFAVLFAIVGPRVVAQGADEFFIISSINPAKRQVIVKRPTEVTQVIFVNDATRYLDRNGKMLTVNDLRAGDTVYIRERRDATGSAATEIRKGPMTVAELRKRYLQTKD